MWRDLFVLCLVPLAVLASPMSQGYKDDGYDNGGYDKDSYGDKGESYTKDDGYGKKMTCTPVFDTVFQEFCESYFDRVCRTTHQEKCVDVPDQNCRAVMTNQQKRKCFEVDEVVCKLREDVKYQTVQVGYTVQKCSKVQGNVKRICQFVQFRRLLKTSYFRARLRHCFRHLFHDQGEVHVHQRSQPVLLP